MTTLLLTLLLAIFGSPSLEAAVARPPRDPALEHLLRRTSIGPGWVMYRPTAFHAAADGSYDVLIHFHGAPDVVEREMDASGVNALLVTVNLGVGSFVYHEAFADAAAFDRAMLAVDQAARAVVPNGHRRRLVLSAWSAGHGALLGILSVERHREAIDAVLVADGMHGAFADPRRRSICPASLDPFVAYARLAAKGDKQMVITHSAIMTPDYASTTESADYLAEALALPAAEPDAADATRTVRRLGRLVIVGLPGADKEAHAVHLRRMAQLTLRRLAE